MKIVAKKQYEISLIMMGLEAVAHFAETVESPWNAGLSLGFIAEAGTDPVVLPNL